MRQSRFLRLGLGLILAVGGGIVHAQQTDTSIIFTPSDPRLIHPHAYRTTEQSIGLEMHLSNNGFGMGAFYRQEYTDDLSGVLSFTISNVKDNSEIEEINYWTYDTYVPGKKNRLLMMPLFASVQQRLFKDDIADNFRPYITGGIGPVMILVSPYARYHEVVGSDGSTAVEQDQVEYFTSLKYAQVRYTFGGYIGAGVYFGSQGGPLSGISFRYIYIPYPPGIDVMESGYGYTYKPMKTFGGFFITLTFGTFL